MCVCVCVVRAVECVSVHHQSKPHNAKYMLIVCYFNETSANINKNGHKNTQEQIEIDFETNAAESRIIDLILFVVGKIAKIQN